MREGERFQAAAMLATLPLLARDVRGWKRRRRTMAAEGCGEGDGTKSARR